jgi:predicted transcriptional regulator
MMSTELSLDLPWIPLEPEPVGELVIRRGRNDVLAYDDGITLQVRLLDPAAFRSADVLLADAQAEAGPGRVVLVAGAVPVEWRSALREAGLSFIDVSGTAEIAWPRIRVSTRRLTGPVDRQTTAIPLQKGHALVVQELLVAPADGAPPTITELAERARVSVSTASRIVAQLAEQGLVERDRNWRHVAVRLSDRAGLAKLLADRSVWPAGQVVSGHAWGRNFWDTAASISRRAADAGIAIAVTGRCGAAFLGVLGTAPPPVVRCWADLGGRSLADASDQLRLELAPIESSNVLISADPWRVGLHHRAAAQFEEWSATVAHPVRVWCDLHGEERGQEFAAQLWRAVSDAR